MRLVLLGAEMVTGRFSRYVQNIEWDLESKNILESVPDFVLR